MRYVRFWRGSSNDFEHITYKQEDTMYFVIQPDTNSFIIYLGDNELLSGDDLNSSSIDALEDVIIGKNLHDRQVLMYDALQECWVNASLDKAAGAYVGPTADFQGLPGMLPGAPAGSSDLFFRSDGKWVEQHIEKINNLEGLEHYELIGNITANWDSINKNDLIIIEDANYDTAYYYTGSEWISLSNKKLMNEIEKRPVAYTETVTEPLEITWDGAWGGRPYIVLQQNGFEGTCLVKVSNEFFDAEQLRSGYVTYGGVGDRTVPISELSIQTLKIGNAIIHMVMLDDIGLLFSASENVNVDGLQAEKGIYFFSSSFLDEADTTTLQRLYVSSLSFPSVTYTKYYKLDNNFVDAEWMATESTGVGTKEFSLSRASDAFVLGGVVNNEPLIRLDSRLYTEEELLGARLIVTAEGFDFSWVAVFTEVDEGITIAGMEGVSGMVLLISTPAIQGLPEGLYLSLEGFTVDFTQTSATLEIFNATGQTIPNKLPNKFLDLDWIPKTETTQEVLYEGSVSGSSSIGLKNEPQLLDLDTVLVFHVGDDVREVRGLGATVPIGIVAYKYDFPNGGYIAVTASADNGTQMEYSVESETNVLITLLKRVPNPIPSYFLPDGIGSAAVITINNRIADGIGGHEAEISEAWNGGGRVVLQFTDGSLTLLSFLTHLNGMMATAVTARGEVYLFDSLSGRNGLALDIWGMVDDPARVLFKAEGSTGFIPTALNSTLTAGSTLPAQEGAVFTAINNLQTQFDNFQTRVATITETLESTLSGGAVNG